MISTLLLCVSVVLGLVVLAMGIKQDFTLAPAHAHLNLLGFVVLGDCRNRPVIDRAIARCSFRST
jgi:hypothetical protein